MTQETKFRVWWIPQIPMEPFEIGVESYKQGKWLCAVLADYDNFQFENKVKPDYCNIGGVAFKSDEHTDGEWHDLDDYEAFELGFSNIDPYEMVP